LDETFRRRQKQDFSAFDLRRGVVGAAPEGCGNATTIFRLGLQEPETMLDVTFSHFPSGVYDLRPSTLEERMTMARLTLLAIVIPAALLAACSQNPPPQQTTVATQPPPPPAPPPAPPVRG
jgi:hypothetical protein